MLNFILKAFVWVLQNFGIIMNIFIYSIIYSFQLFCYAKILKILFILNYVLLESTQIDFRYMQTIICVCVCACVYPINFLHKELWSVLNGELIHQDSK